MNPNKYIRSAYIQVLEPIGLRVWDNVIPKDEPLVNEYILVTSQTKVQNERSKAANFEWNCTIVIHIVLVNEKGYSHSVRLDDLEEQVQAAIEEIQIPPFIVKTRYLIQQTDLPIETPTQSIQQRVMTYEHHINNL